MGNSIHSSINQFRNSGWDWDKDGRTHNLFKLQSKPFKDLTESLGEIATSLIIIQNPLVAIVLQNRRRLDLLTAEKGGLCLVLEEVCCFYTNKSGVLEEAARNLTNEASRTPQHLSNSWEN